MDHAPNKTSEQALVGSPPAGLLLTRDLIFTSKITGTAHELGYRVQVAGNKESALLLIKRDQPRAILVDLTAGELTVADALKAYRKVASPRTAFLAFGPHVDVDLLKAARRVGCDLVMPRSEFTAQLPDLIRRYF